MSKLAKSLTKLQELWVERRHSDKLGLIESGLQRSHILLDLTNVCKDICDDCYRESVSKKSPEAAFMDPLLAVEAIMLFEPHKRQRTMTPLYDIELTGGDPFCHPDIVEIVKGIKQICKGIRVTFRTSGHPLIGRKGEKLLESLGEYLDEGDIVAFPGEDNHHSFPMDCQKVIASKVQNNGFFYTFAHFDPYLPMGVGRATKLPADKISQEPYNCCQTHGIEECIDAAAINDDIRNKDKYALSPARGVSIYINHDGNFRYCCFAKDSSILHFDDVRMLGRDEAIHKLALQYFRVKHLPDNLPGFFRTYDPKNEIPGPDNCARCAVMVNKLFPSN